LEISTTAEANPITNFRISQLEPCVNQEEAHSLPGRYFYELENIKSSPDGTCVEDIYGVRIDPRFKSTQAVIDQNLILKENGILNEL